MKFSIFIFDNFFSYRYGKIILGDSQVTSASGFSILDHFSFCVEKPTNPGHIDELITLTNRSGGAADGCKQVLWFQGNKEK